MKKLTLGSGIVASVSIAGVVIIALVDVTARDKIGLELTKLLLQILVIAILGGAVSLLLEDYNRQRQKAETLNDFRKSLLGRLIEAYSNAKMARRLLRARNSIEDYDEQMEVISEIQLDLEMIAEEIEMSSYVFSKADDLKLDIRSMADYLNKLVDEYEKKRPQLPCKSTSPMVGFGLGELGDFIGPYRASRYRTAFVGPYRAALKSARSDILQAH